MSKLSTGNQVGKRPLRGYSGHLGGWKRPFFFLFATVALSLSFLQKLFSASVAPSLETFSHSYLQVYTACGRAAAADHGLQERRRGWCVWALSVYLLPPPFSFPSLLFSSLFHRYTHTHTHTVSLYVTAHCGNFKPTPLFFSLCMKFFLFLISSVFDCLF